MPAAVWGDTTTSFFVVPRQFGTVSRATFEMYEDAADEWRWRLVHDNGNVIADSGEGYASRQKCSQGIDSVKLNARDAEVVLAEDGDA